MFLTRGTGNSDKRTGESRQVTGNSTQITIKTKGFHIPNGYPGLKQTLKEWIP
jgi:hypothetical protein